MNFEKFIRREDIDKNYHSVAKQESVISKGRFDRESNPFAGLYNLDDLDFMYKTTDTSKIASNKVFDMFRRKCHKSDKRGKKNFNLIFSGPLIKSIVDPHGTIGDRKEETDNSPHVRNEVVVYVISGHSTLECLSIKKSNQVTDCNSKNYDPRLFYQIDVENFSFFVRKKSYASVPEALTSTSDHLDRVALVGSQIWVSGLFILEFHNRIQTYDPNRVDPVFGYPSDILDIYDRMSCVMSKHAKNSSGLFKTLIDRADIAGLTSVLEKYNEAHEHDNMVDSEINVEMALIIDSQQKYSVIEYLMLCMMRTTHMVILQTYRNMFTMLISNYVFIRSPLIFARVISFGNRFPLLLMMLGNIKQGYPSILQDISPQAIIEFGISSMYHIDMYLIKTFIQVDDEEQFVEYITRIKMVKKLSNLDSKTGRMIIDWLILFNPEKIIATLIDTRTLLKSDIYRIIFLTETFQLLNEDIIEFIRHKAQKDDRCNREKIEIDNTEQNDNPESDEETAEFTGVASVTDIDRGMMQDIEDGEILDYEEMERDEQESHTDALEDELDEEIDVAIRKGDDGESDLENRLDQIEQDEENMTYSDHNSDEVSDHETKSTTSIPTKVTEHSDSSSESSDSLSIDPDDMICILKTLEEVVKSGLSHSFFLIYQICPQILDDGFLESTHSENQVENIIHWIRSDESLEVLQLMLKFRPEIVNSRDRNGLTPLLSLVKSYDPGVRSIEKVMVHLLTNEADYEATDENGDTILHILAKKRDPQIVNTVLRLVPSIIDHQNNRMMTPIMLAAEFGDESMVYALEGGHADMSYTDRDGNTVYHYICRSGICPNTIVPNEPNEFGFRPSDYSVYSEDFYYFR